MYVASGWSVVRQRQCRQEVVEGEVRSGESFDRRLGDGLVLRVEAVRNGWVVRIVREGEVRSVEDYAELATPPYQSVNPLRITTEFGFRAQDAVGWNPRRFRFAGDEVAYRRMEAAYGRLSRTGPGAAGAENELAKLVSLAPEGSIEVLDARLVPGGADQTRAASLVATHFGTTAHTMEANGSGVAGMPLGRLSWIRFRVRLELRGSAVARRGVRYETVPCPGP